MIFPFEDAHSPRWGVFTESAGCRLLVRLPIRTRSELNTSEHWQARRKRHRGQKNELWAAFIAYRDKVRLPCHVTFVRLAPRILDTDNLASAFKHLRDQLAYILIPGLAPGRADGDSRLAWSYDQKKTTAKLYGVEIILDFE